MSPRKKPTPPVSIELPDPVYDGLLKLHMERGGDETVAAMAARVLATYLLDPAAFEPDTREVPIRLDATTERCLAAMLEVGNALRDPSGQTVLTGLVRFSDDATADDSTSRRSLSITIERRPAVRR